MVGEEGEKVNVDPMLTIQAAQQLAYRAQMAAEKAAAEVVNILKIGIISEDNKKLRQSSNEGQLLGGHQ